MKDTHEKILDIILLPLADVYEAGNKRWQPINPASPEEYEPFRECIAQSLAEGSIQTAPGNVRLFQLTAGGYNKYLARIKALRALR